MEMEYIYKVALVIAAMYITYKLFMSSERYYALNRATILSSVAMSFVIPLVKLPFFNKEVYVDAEEQISPAVMDIAPVEMVAEAEESISFTDIIPYILIAGVALFFLKYLVTTLSIIGKVVFSHKITLREGVKLIISEAIKSPVSWIKYIFMNSHDYQENSREVLTHEMAHINHHHSIDLIFMDLACCLQWFNPAIWLFKRELRAVHEYQADHEVIASGYDAKQYQTLLIKKAAGRKGSSVASSLNHSNLKKRITMMSCKNSSRLAIIKIMIPIAVSALLTAKFAESNAQTIVITSSKDNQINWENQIADKDPLVMVDGKKSSMENVNTSSVKSITVLKDKPAIDAYGEQGSNGVIEITTKDADEIQEQTSENNTPESIDTENIEEKFIAERKIIIESHVKEDGKVVNHWTVVDPPSSPLVIIDGKEGTMDDVDASNVKSMTILKDQAALDQYGAKGANGVVVVTTKNNKKSDKPEKLKSAIPTSAQDTVLTPDVMPEFPGGDRAFLEYIQNNVNYPEEAKSKGIEGTTYLKFIVNKEGKITNISVVKSSGSDLLDQEAIKVIQAAPDFKPGLKDNKPVDVPVSVPIRFGKSKK